MPSSATIDRVKQIVRDSLKLTPEAKMDDHMPLIGGEHDFDSLDVLLVVTNIEKEFGIKIPDRKVGRQVFTSIDTLAQFVENQFAETSSSHSGSGGAH